MEIPFSNDGLLRDEKLLQEFWESLKRSFQVSRSSKVVRDSTAASLRRFETFRDYEDITLMDSWMVSDGTAKTELCFVMTVATISVGGKYSVRNVREETRWPAVVLRLPTDFGSVLIRPETIVDKMMELFSSSEIDFDEHPEFSRRYYVLVSDETKARLGFKMPLLDAFNAEDDLRVEIHGDLLLARIQEPPSEDVVHRLARLGCALARSVR
jgi:hypothetical protein